MHIVNERMGRSVTIGTHMHGVGVFSQNHFFSVAIFGLGVMNRCWPTPTLTNPEHVE